MKFDAIVEDIKYNLNFYIYNGIKQTARAQGKNEESKKILTNVAISPSLCVNAHASKSQSIVKE